MGFTKLSVKNAATPAAGDLAPHDTDLWAIFRALRDARSLFNLRPGHIQTLQAMLSFLRPGHGDTVFASNNEICRRVGGIDERTLRRHIDRFIELGFMKREDSPNRKRYRVRSSGGCAISYGLSLSPFLARANELFAAAQKVENDRRDRAFLRKQILTKLVCLEGHAPEHLLLTEVRKTLRRKLTVAEYRGLLTKIDAETNEMSTAVDTPKTIKMPANDGQIVRHHSRSIKKQKELENDLSDKAPAIEKLMSICDQAMAFTTKRPDNWTEVRNHARTLAPMMGIHTTLFDKAIEAIGEETASSAIFIVLQLGDRVRDFAAYFHSITLGRRVMNFNPTRALEKLSMPSTVST
ncbi:plasmid replication protein RepC [Sulfitobacter sp. F26204]|uniref:plasmid replication protein RepC n=1 Tax=Sulfitobacter sp. F26204 TaxID=2996014 RepID=UPI00225E3CB3|nr:plasmid replication protein RepC [Sulfitobacter sp. F26204]MCX7560563.1 plasmid replication protein RepC [Sulfitobacter sp. F26204]